jgi:serine/threonine protein phosphatase 1
MACGMMTNLTFAIGDVHGSYTKLANLLRNCQDYCREQTGANEARLVFLGDYIDRGRRSKEVVDTLIALHRAAPDRVVCLRGNHEDMLLQAAGGEEEEIWLANGGSPTLHSYRVSQAADIAPDHLAWFGQLPVSWSDGKRFFVHAGIMPGIPLEQQRSKVMLWIREPFLSDQRDHGAYIVHGHTPTQSCKPELFHNRLNLDTFAWSGNPLVAAVFDDRRIGPLWFIADDGSITAAPPINELEGERFASGSRARRR